MFFHFIWQTSVVPPGLGMIFTTNPALKCRAIVIVSLRDAIRSLRSPGTLSPANFQCRFAALHRWGLWVKSVSQSSIPK
jgi:hypothetical protein